MKTVFSFGGTNVFKGAKTKSMIQVDQSETANKLFTVTYGLQRKSGLTYSETCTELGSCILHWQCCEGLADNDGA